MKIHIVSEKAAGAITRTPVRGRRKNETYCFVLADGIGDRIAERLRRNWR